MKTTKSSPASWLSLALTLATLSCGGDKSPTGPERPTVSLGSPADGAVVSGTLDITAAAEHADRVIFSVDGTEVGRDETSPYGVSWNSASVTDGAHAVKARAEGAGGSAEDEIAVTVNNTNPPPPVTVTVAPPAAEVRAGQTQQFTATVTGSADTRVTWSIDEAGRGAISPAGLYTAPGAVPAPPTATVRARSVADPSRSGTAVVTITMATGLTAQEERLAVEAFGAGTDISLASSEAVDLGARAVFTASIQNGNQLTLTGTLTQAGPGSEDFNYAPGPSDRLVIAFSDGTSIQLIFAAFQGFLDGSWEDFRDSHSNLDFRILTAGGTDLRIQSASGPPAAAGVPDRSAVPSAAAPDRSAALRVAASGRAAPAGRTLYQRTLTGTARFQEELVTVNLTHLGDVFSDIDLTGLEYESVEQTTGSVASASGQTQVNAGFRYHLVSVDRFVENVTRAVETQATLGGVTYRYQNVFVRSAFVDNRVSDPDFWVAQGTLSRDGQVIGTVQFDSPVIDGVAFPGPKPVLALAGGGTVPLRRGGLIPPFKTSTRGRLSPSIRR